MLAQRPLPFIQSVCTIWLSKVYSDMFDLLVLVAVLLVRDLIYFWGHSHLQLSAQA
jgi:hypothetical protein